MTTTTRIPTWLELDTGNHPDSCGVCVEECLAILLGQEKTDHPDRVHPIIREVAIQANDAEPDPKKRRLLARTLACQVDTDDVSDEVTNRLAAFVCRFSADRLPEEVDTRVWAALTAAAECLETPDERTRAKAAGAAKAASAAWAAEAAWAAWAACAARAARAARAAWAASSASAAEAAFYADLLTALITEFDRLTGRTECHKFTKADWERVRAALGETEKEEKNV